MRREALEAYSEWLFGENLRVFLLEKVNQLTGVEAVENVEVKAYAPFDAWENYVADWRVALGKGKSLKLVHRY